MVKKLKKSIAFFLAFIMIISTDISQMVYGEIISDEENTYYAENIEAEYVESEAEDDFELDENAEDELEVDEYSEENMIFDEDSTDELEVDEDAEYVNEIEIDIDIDIELEAAYEDDVMEDETHEVMSDFEEITSMSSIEIVYGVSSAVNPVNIERYEAESGELTGVAKTSQGSQYSGEYKVEVGDKNDGAVTITVDAQAEGYYWMDVAYTSGATDRYYNISIQSLSEPADTLYYKLDCPNSGSFDTVVKIKIRVYLYGGQNEIIFSTDWYAPNLDYIDLAGEPVKYEAENAELTGAAEATADGNCSGGYRVKVGDFNDGAVVIEVNAPVEGYYNLDVGYTLGGNDRDFNIEISNTDPLKDDIAYHVWYKATASGDIGWNTVGVSRTVVYLYKGENSIRFSSIEYYAPNLDYIELSLYEDEVIETVKSVYEAEDAELIYSNSENQPSVSNSSNCSDGKKVDNINWETGVNFTVTVASAGIYALVTDYCTGEPRNITISVNEGSVITQECTNTLGWDVPASAVNEIYLNEGSNTILISSDGYGPNLDRITLNKASVLENNNTKLFYDIDNGVYTLTKDGRPIMQDVYSAYRLKDQPESVTTLHYTNRDIVEENVFTSFGSGKQITVTHTGDVLPALVQKITMYDEFFLTEIEISSSNEISTNWIAPVVVNKKAGVDLGISGNVDYRALEVPFDNDSWISFESSSINGTGESYEVASFFDNNSRQGIVAGSVTHDTWKTGLAYTGANNKLDKLTIYGGASSDVTRDKVAHGYVSGTAVSSPLIIVGYYEDWRTGLDGYAKANTLVVPKKETTGGVPFGWNSWGDLGSDVNYNSAAFVSDYIANNLPEVADDGGITYINLDSYWTNIGGPDSQTSEQLMRDFVQYCKDNGQKAGIYWSPFVAWQNTVDWLKSARVEGSSYYYYDIILRKSGNTNDIHDNSLAGAYPVDVTHPGAIERMDYYLDWFKKLGFEYIKLDFLTHGSLEGAHYDSTIQTGVQAYNKAMDYILDKLDGTMFINLSIAPIFPYQYADGRRLACDTYSDIRDTKYMLNSLNYGFWQKYLYTYPDPDYVILTKSYVSGHTITLNEARSAVTSRVIAGTSFLTADDFRKDLAQEYASKLYTNGEILDVARIGKIFRPIEGNADASEQYIMEHNGDYYIAVFNFGNSSKNITIDLNRAGISFSSYSYKNLWNGQIVNGSSNTITLTLEAMDSTILHISTKTASQLGWDLPANVNGLSLSTKDFSSAGGNMHVVVTGQQFMTKNAEVEIEVNGVKQSMTLSSNTAAVAKIVLPSNDGYYDAIYNINVYLNGVKQQIEGTATVKGLDSTKTRFEAEDGVAGGDAKIINGNFSNGSKVDNIWNGSNGSVAITVNVEEDGYYWMDIAYGAENDTRLFDVVVQSMSHPDETLTRRLKVPATGSMDTIGIYSNNIFLYAGESTIEFSARDWYGPSLDYIDLSKAEKARYEAEEGQLTSNPDDAIAIREDIYFSSSKIVDNMHKDNQNSVAITVEAEESGYYWMDIAYGSWGDDRYFDIDIVSVQNSENKSYHKFQPPATGNNSAITTETILVFLYKGKNTVTFSSSYYSPSVDYIDLYSAMRPALYEAESGVLSGNAKTSDGEQYSGSKKVEIGDQNNGSVTITVNAPVEGYYILDAEYISESTDRYFNIDVISGESTIGEYRLNCSGSGGWNIVAVQSTIIYLNEGNNELKFFSEYYSPHLDAISLSILPASKAAVEGISVSNNVLPSSGGNVTISVSGKYLSIRGVELELAINGVKQPLVFTGSESAEITVGFPQNTLPVDKIYDLTVYLNGTLTAVKGRIIVQNPPVAPPEEPEPEESPEPTPTPTPIPTPIPRPTPEPTIAPISVPTRTPVPTPTPAPTPTPTPVVSLRDEENQSIVTVQVDSIQDENGGMVSNIDKDIMKELIDIAMEQEAEIDEENDFNKSVLIEINVNADKTIEDSQVVLPKNDVNIIARRTGADVKIDLGNSIVTFDNKALDAISAVSGGSSVVVRAEIVSKDSLSEEQQAVIGNHPVYEFSVSLGMKNINSFGDGKVNISIPYSLKFRERPNAIVVYYIDNDGNMKTVRGKYNAASKTVDFTTNHFSVYAVAYNPVSFEDVSDDQWYSDAVEFIAARQIVSDIAQELFAPMQDLTRSEFIVMLMKAYAIAPDSNPVDNFADAGDTYYTGYLSAAKRLAISSGVGDNQFAPEALVTRQEIFTLLYNTLKIINELPEKRNELSISISAEDFEDFQDTALWAVEAMKFMVEAEIVSGTGDMMLSPKELINRASMAQLLYNLLSK